MLFCWDCMSRILLLSISARVEGYYTLWMWKRIGLHNYWQRLEMTCCWSLDWEALEFPGRRKIRDVRVAESRSIFWKEDKLQEDLEWRMLLDRLNDVKVSKGVLVTWTRVTILMRVIFWPLQYDTSRYFSWSFNVISSQVWMGFCLLRVINFSTLVQYYVPWPTNFSLANWIRLSSDILYQSK